MGPCLDEAKILRKMFTDKLPTCAVHMCPTLCFQKRLCVPHNTIHAFYCRMKLVPNC